MPAVSVISLGWLSIISSEYCNRNYFTHFDHDNLKMFRESPIKIRAVVLNGEHANKLLYKYYLGTILPCKYCHRISNFKAIEMGFVIISPGVSKVTFRLHKKT